MLSLSLFFNNIFDKVARKRLLDRLAFLVHNNYWNAIPDPLIPTDLLSLKLGNIKKE